MMHLESLIIRELISAAHGFKLQLFYL